MILFLLPALAELQLAVEVHAASLKSGNHVLRLFLACDYAIEVEQFHQVVLVNVLVVV